MFLKWLKAPFLYLYRAIGTLLRLIEYVPFISQHFYARELEQFPVTFVDKVEHFEIPADDVERARSFYMKVFGWEMNPVPGVNYTRLLTIRVDDKINLPRAFEVNGAIIKRTEDIAAPVVTITVNEMDNALKRIEQEGGKIIVGKKEFGDRGYTAYFKDTEGNIMGLWQVRARVE